MKNPIENIILDKDKPVYSAKIDKQREEIVNSEFVNAAIKAKKERREYDPYFPFYHYVNGFDFMNDPNGLCYWNDRWHLFYQQFYTNEKGERTIYWGHAVSKNMLEWAELPFAIYPGPEYECWSGATTVEDDRVTALYYGKGGNFEGLYSAVSNDPLLLNWTKTTDGPCLETRLTEDRAIALAELREELKILDKPIFLVGDGANLTYKTLSGDIPNLILPPEHRLHQRAVGVALLAEKQQTAGDSGDANALNPNYLRLSQAERERMEKEKNK